MCSNETFQLTTKDHAILEVMRERAIGRDAIVSEILRRKLSRAMLMFREDIAPEVVTLSSRVRFRVDDAPAETRIITPDEMRGLVGQSLPISHPRALALIGLAEGQSMSIAKADGGTERVTVLEVVDQPEAARRERLGTALSAEAVPPRPVSRFLRLVHDAGAQPAAPSMSRAAARDGGPDDPGPSAA